MAVVAEKICRLLKEDSPVHVCVSKSSCQKLPSENSMRLQFGRLVTKTRDSVEERTPVVKFAGSILALGAYEPAPKDRDRSLLDEHREEIKHAKSISEVFITLTPYWNYLNYELLEYIIELYGTSDDNERLKSYNEELCKFCEHRLSEFLSSESCSSNGNALCSKQESFSVKLNVREGVTCKELLQIRRRIAEIFCVKRAALIIDHMDAGYVQLTFLIPKFIAKEIFPLSKDKTSALSKEAAVIRLECGDYVVEPPLLKTEPTPLETEPSQLETEPSPLETEPPPPETEPPPPETEPPPPETEPPPLETEPPLLENEPPLLENEPPQLETEPPPLETDPPLLEMEHPLLETEALSMPLDSQVHRKRKLKDDPETDQPAPKRPIMTSKAGPSKPSPSASRVRQHTFKFLHKVLPSEPGGYDCEFVDPPPKVLETKCPICLHVLRKPKQTDCCGQIFCETCIEPVQACPMCNKTDFSTFHDKKLQRALNELQVRCTYQERGCTWTGELGKFDKHFDWGDLSSGCKFADIQCEFSSVGCKTEMTYQDMMVHMEEEKSYHIQLLTKKVEEQNSEINQLQSELQNSKELLVQIQQQVRRVAPHLPSHEKFHQLMKESRELTQLLDTPISELVQKSLQTTKPSQRISADFSFIMEDFDLHKRTNAEWYSKPFHTHPQGYKMCVRIDANGYEWVKGTHVSLYTCMLKGEYDDELLWPFRGEIAVELLSQDATHTEGNHYTIQYDDNVRDRFARRVTVGERSPGWGNHTFLPHFKLGPYLKDDCLKFRVHIEL